MSKYFVALLLLCVTACLSHDPEYGVKGGRSGNQQGIKSYGGYFPDSGHNHGHGHGHNHYTQQNYQPQVPNYYQPYGWNYNQPTRTYGKFNVVGFNGGYVPQSKPL